MSAALDLETCICPHCVRRRQHEEGFRDGWAWAFAIVGMAMAIQERERGRSRREWEAKYHAAMAKVHGTEES